MLRILAAGLTCAIAVLAIGGGEPHSASALGLRNYMSSMACASGARVTTTFVIPDADELRARFGSVPAQVWVDLTLFDNGFAPGTFIGLGPFAPSAEGPTPVEWAGMTPGLGHVYRLNALTPAGWQGIGGGGFQTPNCATIVRIDCTGEDSSTVLFYLPPAFSVAGGVPQEQWIDMSLNDFSFRAAGYLSAGPFPAEGATFPWSGVLYGRPHNYRVNAFYAGRGWIIQTTGGFSPPDCRNLPAAV